MQEKWKGLLILIFAYIGMSCIAYHEAGTEAFLGFWIIISIMGIPLFIMARNIKPVSLQNKNELSEEIHKLFQEKKTVEVALHVTDEEFKKIKEVLKKEQIIRFYAKLVDEEIRITMKVGEEEYPNFFVYRNYSEFIEKFSVLK